MKIPSDFEHFEGMTTLLIVAGRQDAIFYRAANGEIEKIDSFKIPTPKYSDHEGQFKQRGHGFVISSGGVAEIKDEDIIREFLQEFKKHIKNIAESDYGELYLFAPEKTKNKIRDSLPPEWKKKIRMLIQGNFYYRTPLQIVEKITREKFVPIAPVSEEEKKILEKAEQAKGVMRTRPK